MRRVTAVSVTAVIALALGAAGGWAGSVLLAPAREVPAEATHVLVRSEEGAVSSTVQLRGSAMWELGLAGVNEATGVVTSIGIEPGDEVAQCQWLYSVDAQPVVAAQGAVPAYRSLAQGDRGEDVSQLQEMLRSCGFLADEPDGIFGRNTAAAVSAWQVSLGLPRSSAVPLGRVMFLPALPARVVFEPDTLARGLRMDAGETVLFALAAFPTLAAGVSTAQVGVVTPGKPVTVTVGEFACPATVESVAADDDGIQFLAALAPDPEACGELRSLVAPEGLTPLEAEVEVVPETTGTVVPAAAVTVLASGATAVVGEDGTPIEVDVLAQARGQVAVAGLEPGVLVRVPGD